MLNGKGINMFKKRNLIGAVVLTVLSHQATAASYTKPHGFKAGPKAQHFKIDQEFTNNNFLNGQFFIEALYMDDHSKRSPEDDRWGTKGFINSKADLYIGKEKNTHLLYDVRALFLLGGYSLKAMPFTDKALRDVRQKWELRIEKAEHDVSISLGGDNIYTSSSEHRYKQPRVRYDTSALRVFLDDYDMILGYKDEIFFGTLQDVIDEAIINDRKQIFNMVNLTSMKKYTKETIRRLVNNPRHAFPGAKTRLNTFLAAVDRITLVGTAKEFLFFEETYNKNLITKRLRYNDIKMDVKGVKFTANLSADVRMDVKARMNASALTGLNASITPSFESNLSTDVTITPDNKSLPSVKLKVRMNPLYNWNMPLDMTADGGGLHALLVNNYQKPKGYFRAEGKVGIIPWRKTFQKFDSSPQSKTIISLSN